MEILKGIAIIFGISLTGEVLSDSLNLPIPGSIVGLLLLFFALQFKIIKEKDISTVSEALQDNMAFLFVPLVVSLSLQKTLFKDNWFNLLIIITLTTIITYIAVLKFSEKVSND